MTQLSGQSSFTHSLWLSMGALLIFFITFGLLTYSELEVKKSRAIELKSFLLSDELRQTSDDLTHMARLYVSTSDPLYKQHYQEILDIRDGRAPRPVLSDEIYWDLVLSNNQRPRPNVPAVSLLTLMRLASFTENEFLKLAQSKANSDRLTQIEKNAMNLIEASSPVSDATRVKAIDMLSDGIYLHAKYNIMKPIAKFNRMVKQRTQKNVRANEQLSGLLFAVLVLCGALIILMLLRSYRALNATLGCSADKLRAALTQIGSGDFSAQVAAPQGLKNTVLTWLTEMQAHLQQIETERNKMEVKIRELAYYDPLCNLPNRRLLIDRLGQALALSKRTGHYGALMFIDVDKFKSINDEYGHGAGDSLIREVGKRLTHSVREMDTVSRFGGDEFVVILSDLVKDKAEATSYAILVAEKIRKILAEPYSIMTSASPVETFISHQYFASIGIVLFFNHEKTHEELLTLADKAMYQSKEHGGNQVRVSEK